MGDTGDKVILYAAQADAVLKAIERDGRCFSQEEYVRRKYGESGPIFLTVYKWFVKEAVKLVPRPEGAEFPYWSFMNLYSLDQSPGTRTLTLCVPRDEAVFFDMYDWNKILCLKYLGEDEADDRAFQAYLKQCGVREMDAVLTGFYPELKQKIMDSWPRLFRHHEQIRAGEKSGAKSVQAALWQIKKEWIVPETQYTQNQEAGTGGGDKKQG